MLRQQPNMHCTHIRYNTLQHTATCCNTGDAHEGRALTAVQSALHSIYTATHCNTLQQTAMQYLQATREKDMFRQQLSMHEEKQIKDSDEVQELQMRLAKSTEAVQFSDQVCCSALQCGLQCVAVCCSVGR